MHRRESECKLWSTDVGIGIQRDNGRRPTLLRYCTYGVFRGWLYNPGAWRWTVKIHVSDSPEIRMLSRCGWSCHTFDWSRYWHVYIGLGGLGITYDGNARRRQGWETRYANRCL